MSVRCGRESVSLCVFSLSSPAALLSVCPFALVLMSLPSTLHERQGKASGQMAVREKSSRREEREKTQVVKIKSSFCRFPFCVVSL